MYFFHLSQCIKKIGTVEEVIEAVGVKVKFNGFDSWILHPVVLVKVSWFSYINIKDMYKWETPKT